MGIVISAIHFAANEDATDLSGVHTRAHKWLLVHEPRHAICNRQPAPRPRGQVPPLLRPGFLRGGLPSHEDEVFRGGLENPPSRRPTKRYHLALRKLVDGRHRI